MKIPRGIRNNNPANILRTSDRWIGQSDSQPDDRFVSFIAPEYGLRALMLILLKYSRGYQLSTVEKIISRFAPPSENDTESYIKAVSDHLGVDPYADIAPFTKKTLIGLAEAIVRHENGKCDDQTLPFWYDRDVYDKAYDMTINPIC